MKNRCWDHSCTIPGDCSAQHSDWSVIKKMERTFLGLISRPNLSTLRGILIRGFSGSDLLGNVVNLIQQVIFKEPSGFGAL